MGARPPVTLTNPDKVLYPATGTTKADVFDYYTRIAPVLLPHLAGRPVTRKRWPDGVDHEPFFEKQLAASAPGWLSRGTVDHRAGPVDYPIIDTVEALAWIAQQAALEVHVPQWRFVHGRPGPATRLVFDLDPGQGVGLAEVAEVARAVRELVEPDGLTLYPVTSGSKGIHLYAPLDPGRAGPEPVELAERVARELAERWPQRVTATMTRSRRAGRVLVDWSQNNAAKTTVAPYSLRGRATPTVAAPRRWAELDDPGLRQLRYDEVLARVARDGDLLADLDRAPAPPVRAGVSRSAAVPFTELTPMLAAPGSVAALDPAQWAFEGKWDGYRLLVHAAHGVLRLRSRGGLDVTDRYRSLQSVADALAAYDAVLDGELVAPDADGVPSFAALQRAGHRGSVQFWAFDLLALDGRSLLGASYRDRRRLLTTLAAGTGLRVPDLLAGPGTAALAEAARRGFEGVVAKRWTARYQPGRRSSSWIKQKHWRTQEVVIGGWHPGAGGTLGSLLMGLPAAGGLAFVGRVGTGFSDADRARLVRLLEPLATPESPFHPPLPDAAARAAVFVAPRLVGEVRYRERTTDGRLRHPSWRGLRSDKTPDQVVREE